MATQQPTSGAPSNLGQQLESALPGAEIRQMQSQIGIDNSDEGDIRKVQTFRNHLRADEDIDLAGTKRMERLAVSIFACHRVRIHPPNDGVRKNRADIRLHLFRAEASVNQRVFSAFRTASWNRGAVSAKVTAQARIRPMEGERDTAIWAVARLATLAAKK